MEFKKGDKVICIDPIRLLQLGSIYTVEIPEMVYDSSCLQLEEYCEAWYKTRFILATELIKALE